MFIKTNTVKIAKVLTDEEIEVDTTVKTGDKVSPKIKVLGELVSQNLKQKVEK